MSVFCPILNKIVFCGQIFIKVVNIKFHENPPNESRGNTCGQTDGQTDMAKITGAFCDCVNTPKKNKTYAVVAICVRMWRRIEVRYDSGIRYIVF